MLVAISGSQGSGKTTVLNELAKLGFNIIERKTARSVMTEQFPGMTLDDIYADPVVAAMWQEAILLRKIEDEREAIESNQLWFTERTYADLFTYAVMAVGKNNKHSEWLDGYFERCRDQDLEYLHTFYLEAGKFKPVADGVRGTNQHYQSMIDATLWRVLTEMHTKSGEQFPSGISRVTSANTNERAEMVVQHSMYEFFKMRRKDEPKG